MTPRPLPPRPRSHLQAALQERGVVRCLGGAVLGGCEEQALHAARGVHGGPAPQALRTRPPLAFPAAAAIVTQRPLSASGRRAAPREAPPPPSCLGETGRAAATAWGRRREPGDPGSGGAWFGDSGFSAVGAIQTDAFPMRSSVWLGWAESSSRLRSELPSVSTWRSTPASPSFFLSSPHDPFFSV